VIRLLCEVCVIEDSGLLGHADVSRDSVVLDGSEERSASVFRVKTPIRVFLPRSFEMAGTTHPTTQSSDRVDNCHAGAREKI
jgi:hypothetical protein